MILTDVPNPTQTLPRLTSPLPSGGAIMVQNALLKMDGVTATDNKVEPDVCPNTCMGTTCDGWVTATRPVSPPSHYGSAPRAAQLNLSDISRISLQDVRHARVVVPVRLQRL